MKKHQSKDATTVKKYNVMDCIATARAFRPMWKELSADPRALRIYEVQREKARIAAEMHTHGIPIDRERYVWMKWALWREYGEREKAFINAVGRPGAKCSPNYMRAIIYKRHATGKYAKAGIFNLPDPWDPAMYTDPVEMDTCAVDTDALTQLLIDPGVPADLKVLINLYWDAEAVWKQRATFVASKLVRQAIGTDWYLRPGWNSCGTDTGRFSCSEPNVLNIEKVLRWMYMAKPGNLLVGADWAQLELRTMEAVTGDRVLKAAIDAGDVYSEDAKAWFGLPAGLSGDEVKAQYGKARKASKILHLGCQYGAGLPTVHRQALQQDRKFDFQMTKLLHAKFRTTYSQTVSWWKEEFDRVCKQGYSESRILGRRRVYPREPKPTETNNYPNQATAADIADLALIEADRRLKKEVPSAAIIIQQYDAIYVDCREKDAPRVVEILRDCMEVERTIDGRTRTFPTDIQVGTSWDQL